MKTLSRILVVMLAGAAASASADTFIRPAAYYVSPTTDGYSSAGAGAVSIGFSRGENLQHEFSMEVAYVRWNSSTNVSGIAVSGSEHYMPYLANYRFLFGQKGDTLRAYIGPAIGVMNSRIDVSARSRFGSFSDSSSAWAFAAAGSAGVVLKLSDKVNLDIGYKYLHAEAASYTIAGVNLEAGAARAHMLGAGIGIRF